jgi:hypothetical protein
MIATPDAKSPSSFRDPAGVVVRLNDRILRVVRPDSIGELEAFFETRTAHVAIASGTLVSSERLSTDAFPNLDLDSAEALYEHERVPFPSYPYEWPAEMLHAAGTLTLDLAVASLEEGFGLKDATPYNVLFRGPRPVFVDVLSFERRDARDATWRAYAQFVRTFLLPLLANRDLGWPLQQTLSGWRDGLEPEAVYRATGFLRRLARPYFELVSLPTWLAARRGEDASLYHPKLAESPEQAGYILRNLLNGCRKQLNAAGARSGVDSTWSQYLDHKSLYSPQQLAEKEAFVREALELARPATVLDAGANDLTRPTPAHGWRNQECASFLDRANGAFDLVLMLALMHHILVTERIPLEELLALAAELSRDYMLIEFVAPEDPKFQRIVRGREALYSHLTKERFETAAQAHWELVRSKRITGLHRWLYLYRMRRAKS